jgi:NAD(P)-dependent dehydrogenase (short-subunit alcohol dehydrogenase family)
MKANIPTFDLTGKVAVVTGSARGIGFAVAETLASYGADIVLVDRLHDELGTAKKAIEETGRRAMTIEADLTKVSEIHTMAEKAAAAFGHLDILVNCAGINIQQMAVDVTEEAWDKILDINLKALFFCCQAVGKVMIKQKSGKIINMSSQTGTVGIPRRAAYCASKGAVNMVTKLLAVEWAPYNINVNAVAPTFVETKFTEPMFKDEEFKRYCLDNVLLGRLGKPSDVAGAVLYLASSAADLATGHVLAVDGGWTAR